MKTFLVLSEFIISIALIIGILLHSAKGEGLGAIGGSAKLFRSQRGMESGLNKGTSILAFLFLAIGFILGVYY